MVGLDCQRRLILRDGLGRLLSLQKKVSEVEAGFEIVQLEKMQPAGVGAVADFARASSPATLIVAAGGISPANARAYVEAGAGLIVSSWPYTAKPADVAVSIASAASADHF